MYLKFQRLRQDLVVVPAGYPNMAKIVVSKDAMYMRNGKNRKIIMLKVSSVYDMFLHLAMRSIEIQ